MGKAVRKLLLLIVLCGMLACLNQCVAQTKSSCLEIDIMLVGDTSGSCKGNEQYLSDAFKAFIDRFELSDTGIRIGIVTFSDGAVLRSQLTSNKKALYQVCSDISHERMEGMTRMELGLEMAGNQLINTDPAKIGRSVPKLIILVTDGEPDNTGITSTISSQLQNLMNVGICGIFIQTSHEPINYGPISNGHDYLKSIVSEFCRNVVSTDFDLLAEEMKKLDICL